ncbi:MAG: hypothetical protein QOJ42_5755 [Acidobacteriaceae bacterium]|nr:hypothetical protein [Acidobacteriaceae bacterium]
MAQVLAEAEKDPTKSGTPYSNCMRDDSAGLVFLRKNDDLRPGALSLKLATESPRAVV